VYSSPDAESRLGPVLPWLAYPLAVWAALALAGPRAAGALVLAALALRALPLWRHAEPSAQRRVLVPVAAAGLPALVAVASGDPRLLLFVPALASLGLLYGFARTLRRGPPLVETIARLQVGELSPAEVRYCRTVTWLWCAFFAANALVGASLALRGSLAAWALGTGVLSYAVVGLLFAGELGVRSFRFRHYGSGPGDALMRRLFPPRGEPAREERGPQTQKR
jgi:uncharacterized membrane protein